VGVRVLRWLLALYGAALLLPGTMFVVEPTWLDSHPGDTIPWQGRVQGAALLVSAVLLIAPPRFVAAGRTFSAALTTFAILIAYWIISGAGFARTAHSAAGTVLGFFLLAAMYLLPLLLVLCFWVRESRRPTLQLPSHSAFQSIRDTVWHLTWALRTSRGGAVARS
jgi:hypothetical protein